MNGNMEHLNRAIYQDNSLDKEINLILQERLLRYKDNFGFGQSSANCYSEELCSDNNASLSMRLWKTISSSEIINHWLSGYGYLRLSELVFQISNSTEVFKRVIERDKGKHLNNRKRSRREFIAPYIWQNHKRRNPKKPPKESRLIRWSHDNKDAYQAKNPRISTDPTAVSPTPYSKSRHSLSYRNSFLFQNRSNVLIPETACNRLFCDSSALPNDKTMLDIQFSSTDAPVEVRKVLQSLFS